MLNKQTLEFTGADFTDTSLSSGQMLFLFMGGTSTNDIGTFILEIETTW